MLPKKCTFNCVYCQLGKTKVQVSGPEMLGETLVDVNEVVDDLDKILKRLNLDTVDMVTFSGTGEPTLNPRLGKIAQAVRERVSNLPLAVLTNSSLLHRVNVGQNLSQFDMVVAKLDAGDDDTFRAINRPVDNTLHIDRIVESIKRLKEVVRGTVALQVMLIHSRNGKITNVMGKSLRNLIEAILDVKPDQVQLEVPYRPPSESFVKPPSKEKVELIFNEVSGVLGEGRLWVYGLHDKREKGVTWLSHESLENEVIEMLKRRPCRVVDVSTSLGIDISTAQSLLRRLRKNQFIVAEMSEGEKYFSCEKRRQLIRRGLKKR
ncbi:MAG: radical SAM protein [Candidatus Bathyarchaeota archaeon]|nr:radical SAM protein [Candidatus Bathyarchaeota archaeon]